MLSSVVRSFTDPDEYAAVIYPSTVELTVIRRGHFAASHTGLDLHRLRVLSASEILPRARMRSKFAGATITEQCAERRRLPWVGGGHQRC
jgi:hypothetical protein